jgi:hypothetical protein
VDVFFSVWLDDEESGVDWFGSDRGHRKVRNLLVEGKLVARHHVLKFQIGQVALNDLLLAAIWDLSEDFRLAVGARLLLHLQIQCMIINQSSWVGLLEVNYLRPRLSEFWHGSLTLRWALCFLSGLLLPQILLELALLLLDDCDLLVIEFVVRIQLQAWEGSLEHWVWVCIRIWYLHISLVLKVWDFHFISIGKWVLTEVLVVFENRVKLAPCFGFASCCALRWLLLSRITQKDWKRVIGRDWERVQIWVCHYAYTKQRIIFIMW